MVYIVAWPDLKWNPYLGCLVLVMLTGRRVWCRIWYNVSHCSFLKLPFIWYKIFYKLDLWLIAFWNIFSVDVVLLNSFNLWTSCLLFHTVILEDWIFFFRTWQLGNSVIGSKYFLLHKECPSLKDLTKIGNTCLICFLKKLVLILNINSNGDRVVDNRTF